MILVFDTRIHKETSAIQSKIDAAKSGFRTKWGLYGTTVWYSNLEKDGLIETLQGTITELLMTGHNDFPEFEMSCGFQKFQFERLGKIELYQVGKKIRVEALRTKYIRPISGLENCLSPIRIEIEM